ncbi:DUF746 domain-containing protein [Ralstonia pseudosolanacearum]|uniref:DUF746 domain-containing protein n=1 Tax=Ralstonia pseudosolanacearum TaxID=1310165 RepID=UPI003CE74F31
MKKEKTSIHQAPSQKTRPAANTEPKARSRRHLADITLPFRILPYGPLDRLEDRSLTAFLRTRVDIALSLSTSACVCPWCGGGETVFHPVARPSQLPGFICHGCHVYFMRVSNTPLVHPPMRELALRLVPILGWKNTIDVASQELGVSADLLQGWVKTWRQWLLQLDPTGGMESRVRLGLPVAEPSVLRNRAAKRREWLARAWLKRGDGFSYLSADGYVIRVGQSESVWRYEVRSPRMKVPVKIGDGFRTTADARFAAFDAITELLIAASSLG